MKTKLFSTLFVTLFAVSQFAFAIDSASLPEVKRTKLGLYMEAKEVPAFLEKHGKKVLFLDLRTPEELLFVGMADRVDGNASFGIMNYSKWDDKKNAFPRAPNPDFLSNFEFWAIDKGIEKNDPVVLICRSGDRSALGADFLARNGYTNVWSVVDGFEGDLASDGPNKGQRVVNGWKNAGLPWSYKLNKTKLLLKE